jgi:hypothetical protein
MKIESGASQNILDFITEASSKIQFCEKNTKKVSPIEIFTGHSLNRSTFSDPSSIESECCLTVI